MTKSNNYLIKHKCENITFSHLYAFTLSEVLITLIVIGVIAALTVPALVTNIQDEQHKTALKRVYSDLTQVVSKMVLDNGGSLKGLCNYDDGEIRGNCIKEVFANYMSYAKVCDTYTSLGNCWPASYKNLNNDDTNVGNWAPGFVLNNGASLMINLDTADCNVEVGTPSLYNRCGWMFVDINGIKSPNKWGRDIFWINLTENGIKPAGIPGDDLFGTCASGSSGWGCAGYYLRNQPVN